MPVEETAWDVVVSREFESRHYEQLRAALADTIAKRLPSHKKLRRIVAWSPNGGCLFRPQQGACRYAVSYEVVMAV
jgi:hypothetical protein